MTIQLKKPKINLREKLAELLNFNEIRDSLSGLGLFLGKDRTNNERNISIRGGADIDDLHIAEISAALGGTAVDVFVYDTRRDSDGGAWRERTSHTSWYNEPLNTATRGGRREFPAVAVIVAESDKVTIYDGDDPDLNMWMVFGDNLFSTAISSVYILNGNFCCGTDTSMRSINFVEDKIGRYSTGDLGHWGNSISEREESLYGFVRDYSITIINNNINDVAMTVLPNALIDSDTGLPIPTIAVATDGGVSVIRDDGSVVDITCSNPSFIYSYYVVFDQLNRLFFSLDGQNNKRRIWGLNNIPATDLVVTTDINEKQNGDIFIADNNGYGTTTKDMFLFNQSNPQSIGLTSDNSIGTDQGLFKAFIDKENSSKSLYNYTTSSYNTGWMPGDIKLATLSDTKTETVGVDESAELVTNDEFTTDSDWSKGTGWTIDGGVATKTGSDNTSISQDIDTIVGKKYVVSLDIVSGTVNSGAKLYVDGVLVLDNLKDAQSISGDFVATDDSTTIAINGGSFDGGSIDNISVKQTGELITNGTFDNGTEGWILSSSNAPTVSSGTLQFNNVDGSAQSHAEQEMATVAGKKYVLSFDYVGSSILNIYIGKSQGTSQILNSNVNSSGAHSFSFVATSSSSWIRFRDNVAGSTPTIDSISVRLAEEDRSVNDNGLQVFGEIDKTPVASGADLVAYSGFSADDYLFQPYNSDLDFGTGDFCVMGWAKPEYSHYSYLFHRALVGSEVKIEISSLNNPTGGYRFYTKDANGVTYVDTNSKDVGGWKFVSCVRRNGKLKIYVNAVDDENTPNNTTIRDLSSAGAGVWFGIERATNLQRPFDGNLALWRVTATAPTDEQIAKIYRDEKVLFQDGAQATLYGTSDAVTALAYDDSENLLHVGTASGRSVFNGLKRVDNTTTAVSTAISATEGLVIEQ